MAKESEANLILRFIDDVPVHKVTAAMVRKMDQDMLAKGYARETVALAHNALKRYLYEAMEKGLILAVPITRTVKPPRAVRKDPNVLPHVLLDHLQRTFMDREERSLRGRRLQTGTP